MKIPLLLLLSVLFGCATPRPEPSSAPATFLDGTFKRRWDLLTGELSIGLSCSEDVITAGATIPISLTITNRGKEPVWIPVDFKAYFDLEYRFLDEHHPPRLHTQLDGVSNDPFHARELSPGASVTQDLEFSLPSESTGSIEVFIYGRSSKDGSLMLSIK